jgi:hypothetical protein
MQIARHCAALAAAAGLILGSGTSLAVEDTDLPLGVSWNGDAPGGAPPWVNVLFRDFSDAAPGAYGDFEWIRKTIEVQVTTGSDFYDEPGGSCCGVQGKGNLTAYENLKALWLSFNPRLDVKKLKIYLDRLANAGWSEWGERISRGRPTTNRYRVRGKQVPSGSELLLRHLDSVEGPKKTGTRHGLLETARCLWRPERSH